VVRNLEEKATIEPEIKQKEEKISLLNNEIVIPFIEPICPLCGNPIPKINHIAKEPIKKKCECRTEYVLATAYMPIEEVFKDLRANDYLYMENLILKEWLTTKAFAKPVFSHSLFFKVRFSRFVRIFLPLDVKARGLGKIFSASPAEIVDKYQEVKAKEKPYKREKVKRPTSFMINFEQYKNMWILHQLNYNVSDIARTLTAQKG
jgi:hypothetical protein